MKGKSKVLLVEDSVSLTATYQEYLRAEPIELIAVSTGESAKAFIVENLPDIVLLDLKLPDISGEEILRWVIDEGFPTAVIIITAHGSVDIAVEMIRLGAHDFLQKPFDATRLKTTLHNVIENTRLKHLVENFATTFERDHYHGFIGASLPMQAAYQIIDAAAPSKATVFITGESGTGKEVCAEAIHKQSRCKQGPFIALNCGAIPRDLMESEIFGHMKGAFTGAVNERQGAASLANGGTLFLDEIGEMDLDLQTKLLRFIQTGIVKKVGSNKEEQVDVRFICATNRDPLEEVSAGRFREDLYYRLNVVPLHLPPLRERGDDIILLAKHFLKIYIKEDNKSFNHFSDEVDMILRHYPWPGNVRQLQNVIRNIVVLHNGETVLQKHLPPPLDSVSIIDNITPKPVSITPSQYATSAVAPLADSQECIEKVGVRPLADVERQVIEEAIEYCKGNIPKAAALLEVSPSTIYRKKQAWDT